MSVDVHRYNLATVRKF